MSKLNKKGFMLAEVVVVSVVIATVLVTLYTGLNKVSSAYETRNKYYDIDAIYYAIAANDYIIEKKPTLESNANIDSNLNNLYKTSLKYKLANAYYVKELNTFDSSKQTFKDYLKYLKNNIDTSIVYDYIIITELCKNEDDCYYYALKVKEGDSGA